MARPLGCSLPLSVLFGSGCTLPTSSQLPKWPRPAYSALPSSSRSAACSTPRDSASLVSRRTSTPSLRKFGRTWRKGKFHQRGWPASPALTLERSLCGWVGAELGALQELALIPGGLEPEGDGVLPAAAAAAAGPGWHRSELGTVQEPREAEAKPVGPPRSFQGAALPAGSSLGPFLLTRGRAWSSACPPYHGARSRGCLHAPRHFAGPYARVAQVRRPTDSSQREETPAVTWRSAREVACGASSPFCSLWFGFRSRPSATPRPDWTPGHLPSGPAPQWTQPSGAGKASPTACWRPCAAPQGSASAVRVGRTMSCPPPLLVSFRTCCGTPHPAECEKRAGERVNKELPLTERVRALCSQASRHFPQMHVLLPATCSKAHSVLEQKGALPQ